MKLSFCRQGMAQREISGLLNYPRTHEDCDVTDPGSAEHWPTGLWSQPSCRNHVFSSTEVPATAPCRVRGCGTGLGLTTIDLYVLNRQKFRGKHHRRWLRILPHRVWPWQARAKSKSAALLNNSTRAAILSPALQSWTWLSAHTLADHKNGAMPLRQNFQKEKTCVRRCSA